MAGHVYTKASERPPEKLQSFNVNRLSIDRHKNSRQQSFSTECRETTGGGCACDPIVVRSLLSWPYCSRWLRAKAF